MLNLSSSPLSNCPMSVHPSIAAQTDSPFVEVSGLLDDFTSIEEFAPGRNWEDILAESWGIPSTKKPEKSHVSVRLNDFGRRWVRSIVQSVRPKKFETA